MATVGAHKLNTITWLDLAAADLDAALAFYCDVLDVRSSNDGETPYYMLMVGDQPVAGVMALGPEMADAGMPPVWSTYVSVASAADAVATCKAAGGSVFRAPFEIPGGGVIAVIADPAGAAICIFEGGLEMGFKAFDEPGAACWFETMSRNADAADTFYNKLFGWNSTPMEGMPYRVFDLDGQPVAGMMAMDERFPPQIPSHWAVSFCVADTDTSVERAITNGATLVMPPTDTPYGRAAGLVDPWGAGFNIIERATASL